MTDPWSALQAPGVAADDAAPAGAVIAYEDGDVVGMPIHQQLPTLCAKCGAEGDHPTRDITFKASLAGRQSLTLGFPMCPACAAQRTRAWWWLGLWLSTPLWLVAGALIGGVVADALVPAALLGAFAGTFLIPLVVLRRVQLAVDRVDSDGFVRIRGLHPAVRAEIVRAAEQATEAAIAAARRR